MGLAGSGSEDRSFRFLAMAVEEVGLGFGKSRFEVISFLFFFV